MSTYKATEPCESYFGNVCTGFGGTTECRLCGWDMFDHHKGKLFDDWDDEDAFGE